MINYILYQYTMPNGYQFVSILNQANIRIRTEAGFPIPKCIAVWKTKKINQ